MDVQSSIVLDDCDDTLTDVWDGSVVTGSPCTISNDAPSERSITLSDDAEEGIDVSYVGSLELSKKDTNNMVTGWRINNYWLYNNWR